MGLMNGLSQMGAGLAQYAGTAGLESQKADLAKQAMTLADQLATVRESAGRQEAGKIAADAQAVQNQHQAGEGVLNRANSLAVAGVGAGATIGAARIAEAGAMARTQATINAPPEVIKVLKALGQWPDSSAAPTPSPAASGGSAGAAPSPNVNATENAPAASAPTGAVKMPDINNPLIAKALGMPMPGSEDAIRRALASDVDNDPAFKGRTVGQKAAEVETRLAIASGKLTDPNSRTAMAQAIANYQVAPLSNYALTKPGGPETMGQALRFNPDYQESRYPEINKAMSAFGSGPQGNIIRSLNVGVQHLDVLDKAGDALANGNIQALNSLRNVFGQQFGSSAPTTFDGLKQIVGTEVEKAVAGGIGASSDRDRIMKALDRANSPAQLKAITDGFRALMVGQLSGLKTQYEDATGIKKGPFAFETKLVPETTRALGLHIDSGATVPAASAPAGAVQRLWGQ